MAVKVFATFARSEMSALKTKNNNENFCHKTIKRLLLNFICIHSQ